MSSVESRPKASGSSSIEGATSWPPRKRTTMAGSATSEAARPRRIPPRLPSSLATLPARRARARTRGQTSPRSPPRLLVRVRDLPRQLSVDELAELFEGRTPTRGAPRQDPGSARSPRSCDRRADGVREDRGNRRAPGHRGPAPLRPVGPGARGGGRARGRRRARSAEPCTTRRSSDFGSSSSWTAGLARIWSLSSASDSPGRARRS